MKFIYLTKLLIFSLGLISGIFLISVYNSFQESDYGQIVEVVSVYDGDTFKVNLSGERPLFGENLSIRLRGIDTPEIRGVSDEEKLKAIAAKDFLESMLSGNNVTLHNMERGKYFRVVADVKSSGIDVDLTPFTGQVLELVFPA